MLNIPGYQITELIHQSNNSLVYRAFRESDGLRVILKLLRDSHPTPSRIAAYQREYNIVCGLNLPGVVRVYGLNLKQPYLYMELEDFGGKSLTELGLLGNLTLEAFLELAHSITEIVAQIHRAKLIHKDLNPQNILYNPQTETLKIIDFGISTLLSQENLSFNHPDLLEGTIPYISPEQTGRMNRSVDYRSDFYSLGVTFYQLLTGRLPFESDDILEVIHSHIALQPPSPWEIANKLGIVCPEIVAKIILKLMAKKAEDRYQSAYGLKYDLQLCIEQLHNQAQINDFELGSQELGDRFSIPQKLYGRQEEIAQLISSFERVCNLSLFEAKVEMVLVSGYSGVGKTALVNEVHKPLTALRGSFISGKYDQYQGNIPYYGITQAFNQWCSQILTETRENLQAWQEKIALGIGDNGRILMDIIPKLELIIGEQPDIIQVDSQVAQQRLGLVFINFLKTICQEKHPLVLFMDDLQWADGASLNLLKTIMSEEALKYLLIIGAYRDNELHPSHPCQIALNTIEQETSRVNYLNLDNLTINQVNDLIADTLNCPKKDSYSLTTLIYPKTLGNAFFTTELFKSLHKEKLLEFDYAQQKWVWDLAKIQQLNITNNVVELMASKIANLEPLTQEALQLAACIGNSFDLVTLAIITQTTTQQLLTNLLPALEVGLIFPVNNSYQLILSAIENIDCKITLKFQHDRVQQAAYSLIDDSQKQIIHLQIGRLLLANTPENEREERLFEIVNHLNESISLISDPSEQVNLAQLNWLACKKAKAATAYDAVLKYVNYGLEILGQNSWVTHYQLTKDFYLAKAESSYVLSYFEASEAILDLVFSHLTTNVEKAEVINRKVLLYTNRGRAQDAVNLGIDFLSTLGLHLPKKPTKVALKKLIKDIQESLEGKSDADLINLPLMSDPEKIAIMTVLIRIGGPAYFYNIEIYYWLHCEAIKLALEYGNGSAVVRGYCVYGLYLGTELGDYASGYRYGKISEAIAFRFPNPEIKGFSYFLQGFYLNPWCKHLQKSTEILTEAYQAFREVGNLAFACFSIGFRQSTAYFSGKNLEELAVETQDYLDFVQRSKFKDMTNYLTVIIQTALALKEAQANFNLTGANFNEKDFEEQLKSSQGIQFTLNLYYLIKLQLSYLAGNYSQALEYALLSEQNLPSAIGLLIVAEHHYYYCLTLTALLKGESDLDKSQSYHQSLNQKQKLLKKWAGHCPENFEQKWLLIEAEKASLKSQHQKAMDLYDQAINKARDNKYLQDEGIANELAAKYYLGRGKIKIASAYFKDAQYHYLLWGASAKAKDLETIYAEFFNSDYSTSQTTRLITTRGTASKNLDLNSILKASQAISSQIRLDTLLSNLMKLVIENAGAEKGYLILPKNEHWYMEAYGEINSTMTNVLHSIPLENVNISQSIVNYVIRTQTSVVVDNPAENGNFSRDPYILEQQPQSILCTPLQNQGKLIALLYLENNLTSGAFTADRLNIINILSSQASISLENARLYQELQESNQILEQKVVDRTVQLLEATRLAQSASEAKSSFLANMSHELRSPLNAILGFSQLIKKSKNLPLEHQENLSIISRSGEHLLSLINQVLDLSKIEAGKITLNECDFDLYRLLEDLEDMFCLKAEDKNLELIFTRSKDVIQYIHGDQVKLRQILINLINNALKFTSKGGVYLDIRSNKKIPLELIFEVKDTGVGIPLEELDKMFEAFVQTTSGKSSQEGTGLGLTISRKFIQLMGGDIRFSSQVGEGTTFRFNIQITAVDNADIVTQQNRRTIIGLAPNQPRYSILIADDKVSNRQLLGKILTALGFEVIEATNGQEAIDKWESYSPSLILMDLRMPVMHGYEATKRIKGTLKGKNTPIIALTASVLEEERVDIMSAGCDDFMRKPFDTEDLLEAIGRHLGLRYIYDEEIVESQNDKIFEQVVHKETLKIMPQEWLENLYQAALETDTELVDQLVEEIPQSHDFVRKNISEWVEKFQFERILELLEELVNV